MFEMVVDNVLAIHGTYSVGGRCNNKWAFRSPVVDERGTVYKACRPLGKELIEDDHLIDLQLIGDNIDLAALKGRTLKSISA
jgi:hypothetical protein